MIAFSTVLIILTIWFLGYGATFIAMQAWRTTSHVERLEAQYAADYDAWERACQNCRSVYCKPSSPCSKHKRAPVEPLTYPDPAMRALAWPVTLPPFVFRECGVMLGSYLESRDAGRRAQTRLIEAETARTTLEVEREARKLKAELNLTADD